MMTPARIQPHSEPAANPEAFVPHSYAEIGKLLGLTEMTAKQYGTRAICKLRAAILEDETLCSLAAECGINVKENR
jgi:hypothetical protein